MSFCPSFVSRTSQPNSEYAIAQLIALLPIFPTPRFLSFVCKLRDFRRNHDFGLRFKLENSADPIPPIQPQSRRLRVELIFVHRAVRFANGFKQKSQRRGDIQIVIESILKLGSN